MDGYIITLVFKHSSVATRRILLQYFEKCVYVVGWAEKRARNLMQMTERQDKNRVFVPSFAYIIISSVVLCESFSFVARDSA